MNIITPKIKDKALQAILAETSIPCTIYYSNVYPDKEITDRQMELIIQQFVNMKLLDKFVRTADGAFWIRINANIYDFFNHGGFEVQEEILKANIEKLSYELDILSRDATPGLKDKITNISAIAASIATVLSLFKPTN